MNPSREMGALVRILGSLRHQEAKLIRDLIESPFNQDTAKHLVIATRAVSIVIEEMEFTFQSPARQEEA